MHLFLILHSQKYIDREERRSQRSTDQNDDLKVMMSKGTSQKSVGKQHWTPLTFTECTKQFFEIIKKAIQVWKYIEG